MLWWYHCLNGHEFQQAPGDGEGQGSLACCSLWGQKELDLQLNNNNIVHVNTKPGTSSLVFTLLYVFTKLVWDQAAWKVRVESYSLNHVWFFLTPWTVDWLAPLSMEFSRQEYWSKLPFPSPGDLPYPGIKPRSPALQGNSLPTVVLKKSGHLHDWNRTIPMKLGTVSWVLSNFTRFQLFAHPWTIVCPISLSVGFSRQEYWNCLPCPPPGDLPNPGIQSATLTSPVLAGQYFTTSTNF